MTNRTAVERRETDASSWSCLRERRSHSTGSAWTRQPNVPLIGLFPDVAD